MVCRWKCFKDKHARIKDFFVRCVGVLSNITTLENFQRICQDILTVAFSETEDISVNDNKLTCFNAQQRLLNMIKTHNFEYYEGDIDDYLDEIPNNESPKCINNFLRDIEKNSKQINSGDRPNPYYCYDFGINLLRISKEFPLWTSTMTPDGINNVATSARSEEYFNEIKNLIFKGAKNIRADKFLISHIRSISGTMKILNADTTSANETTKILHDINSNESVDTLKDECLFSNNSDSLEIISETLPHTHNAYEKHMIIVEPTQTDILNEVETWKGHKNKEPKRGKYLRACPDVESIHKKPNHQK